MLGSEALTSKAICFPSRERLNGPDQLAGNVTGSGSESVRPLYSSIATFQRFMLPPRSLAK